MNIGLSSAVGFVYTLGVLVTGLWVANPNWEALSPSRLAILVVLALAWTVYFSWTIVPRIVDIETEDEEDDEAGPADSARTGA